MTEPPAKAPVPGVEWSPEAHRAWGLALIKTGTEHLDLGMVRLGRQTLKDAEGATPTAGSSSKPTSGA
jgi:hypothetical protein